MLFFTLLFLSFSSLFQSPILQDNITNTTAPEINIITFTANHGLIDFVGIVPEYKNPNKVEFIITVKDGETLVMSDNNFEYDKIYGIDVFDLNKNKYYLVGNVVSKTYKFIITNFRYIYDYISEITLYDNQLLVNFIYSYNISEYQIIKKHIFEYITNASWYI